MATPYAGLTRSTTSETLRLDRRLGMGASEWSLESAFGAEGRGFSAGYGYRFGDVLSVNLKASRRKPAADEPDHAFALRAQVRF